MGKKLTLKRLVDAGPGSFYRLKGVKNDVTVEKIEGGFVYFSGKDIKGRERKSKMHSIEFCKSVDMDFEVENLPAQQVIEPETINQEQTKKESEVNE